MSSRPGLTSTLPEDDDDLGESSITPQVYIYIHIIVCIYTCRTQARSRSATMMQSSNIKHNFPIREIPEQRFRSKSYFPKAVESVSSNSWSSLCGDSASCGGSSNASSSASSTSSNSLNGCTTSQRQTKNSEHESGYYEDLSDLEDRSVTTVIGTKPTRFVSSDGMRFFTLTAGINKLEMSDSPASPDPEDDGEEEKEQGGQKASEAMISSVMPTPRACSMYGKGKCPGCQAPVKLLHYKKFFLNRAKLDSAPEFKRIKGDRDKTQRLIGIHRAKVNLLAKIMRREGEAEQ